MTLFSWDSHDAWLLLEEDPTVSAFCERPVYVDGPSGRVFNCWVEKCGQSRFWVLSPDGSEDGALPKSAKGVALRILRRPDMIAFSMRSQNWAQIVPIGAAVHAFESIGGAPEGQPVVASLRREVGVAAGNDGTETFRRKATLALKVPRMIHRRTLETLIDRYAIDGHG